MEGIHLKVLWQSELFSYFHYILIYTDTKDRNQNEEE